MEFFDNLWSVIKTIQFRDVVDILAISLIVFGLFKLIRETRALQLVQGILLLVAFYLVAFLLDLLS